MDSIAILDFGSQYAQIIARRVREAQVYCELFPWDAPMEKILSIAPKGFILSGGPKSAYEENAPYVQDFIFKTGLPILGICYGMQALNVSRGGTLIQDIEAQVKGGLKHDQGKPLDRASHSIEIDRDSILGSFESISKNGSKVRVNSHHHQAVSKIGRELKPVAWAKDGIVECIQDTRPDRFVLGVQWHPELSWRDDGLSREIFQAFVTACIGRLKASV